MLAGCVGSSQEGASSTSPGLSVGSHSLSLTGLEGYGQLWLTSLDDGLVHSWPISRAALQLEGLRPATPYVVGVSGARGQWEHQLVTSNVDWGATVVPGLRIAAEYTTGCTLSFLLTNLTGYPFYITAAHCVTDGTNRFLGTAVTAAESGHRIGTVEAFSDAALDVALIKVDDDTRGIVGPKIQGIGGPQGLARQSDVNNGDGVCFYGHSAAREPAGTLAARCGTFTRWHSWRTDSGLVVERAQFEVSDSFMGDSGAPLISYDGGAVGTVLSAAGTVNIAASLCSTLLWAAEAGYDLRLVSAGPANPTMTRFPGTPLGGAAAGETPNNAPCEWEFPGPRFA